MSRGHDDESDDSILRPVAVATPIVDLCDESEPAVDSEEELGIELIMPLDGTEGFVEAFDSQGRKMAVPARMVVRPCFPRPDFAAVVAYIQSLGLTADAPGRVLSRSILRISGKTGRLTLTDRSPRTKPLFMSAGGKDA